MGDEFAESVNCLPDSVNCLSEPVNCLLFSDD
jgi:hypothetical protein